MGIPEGKRPLGKYFVYRSVVLKQFLNKIRWDREDWINVSLSQHIIQEVGSFTWVHILHIPVLLGTVSPFLN
jgi:hypothetical protein